METNARCSPACALMTESLPPSVLSFVQKGSHSGRIDNSRVARDNQKMEIPPAFLVAENGDAAKASHRYQATLAWRKEMRVDSILKTPQTQYDTIKSYVTELPGSVLSVES